MKKTICVISPYNTFSGYGVHSRLIIKSLLKYRDKYDIHLIGTPWGGCPDGFLNPNDPIDSEILSLNVPNNQLTFQPDISIHIAVPTDFQKIGKYSIGISAVTEATLCPPAFIEGANRIDHVIVPSEFSKKVLTETIIDKKDRQTGQVVGTVQCTTPVDVLFEGYDPDVYNVGNIVRGDLIQRLGAIKESFCYLFVGHWTNGTLGQDRKDVSGLIKTFLETFMKKSGKNRPALILKTSGPGFSKVECDNVLDKIWQIKELIRDQSNFKGKFPSIYLINGELSDSEMNTLYRHSKVKSFVTFQKGEAWGLPIAEFATTGKPIICTGYSGPLDYLKPDHHVLLPAKLTNVDPSSANEFIPREGQWATVNYQLASAMLVDVQKNYAKYLQKSRKSVKYMADNFSLPVMAERLVQILDDISLPVQVGLKLPELVKKGSDHQKPTIKLPTLTKMTD